MLDLMIDLETFGTKSNAVVVSISVVVFDMATGDTSSVFDIGVDIKDQLVNGRFIDKDTIEWWSKQSLQAKESLCEIDSMPTALALNSLNAFITNNFKDLKNVNLWGNGATFDNVIIRSLFSDFNIDFVLPYWCDKDVRTLTYLTGINPKDFEFKGTAHKGIDDCLHQINYCSNGFKNYKSKIIS